MIKKINSVCSHCGEQGLFFENLIWLTTKEAADYLRISNGALKNKIYRGELLPYKFGKLNRFKKKDLDLLLSTS